MTLALGTGSWFGGVSDGTTLWFVEQHRQCVEAAYTAATQARDMSRDIDLGTGTWNAAERRTELPCGSLNDTTDRHAVAATRRPLRQEISEPGY